MKAPGHAPLIMVITEVKGAVLPDDGIHGLHAGDVIAPASGPARYWYTQFPSVTQVRQHGVRLTGEPAVGS